MKRTFLAIAVLAVAVPAVAQEDFQDVSFTLGALQKDFDTNSSKFLEYRDIPQGMVLPALRFQGKKGGFRYDLQGRDVTQGDQQYRLKLEDDRFRLTGAYTGVPHNFGNGGKSLLSPVLENEWRIADTTQAGYQNAIIASGNNTSYSFLSALVQPGLDAAPAEHRPEAAAEPRKPGAGLHPRRGPLRRRGDLPPRAPLRHPVRQRHLVRLQQRDRDARAAALHHPGLRRERRPTRATGDRPGPASTSTTSGTPSTRSSSTTRSASRPRPTTRCSAARPSRRTTRPPRSPWAGRSRSAPRRVSPPTLPSANGARTRTPSSPSRPTPRS